MRLHENNTIFKQAVQLTAEKMRLPPIYVEKDYWVTFALYLIYSSPLAADVVFKGGTALCKCFGLIDRFSEDIDLIVVRREGETDNQLKRKLKAISALLGERLPEIENSPITHKIGMHRKTAHAYPKVYAGEFGQVRDFIVLESGWLGNPFPNMPGTVSSFIFEKNKDNDGQGIMASYGMTPFTVTALVPNKTLCEKAMSLVRFSYSEKPLEDLALKIRHLFDLNQLLRDEEISRFFQSEQFDSILIQVAKEDLLSFKNNNDWLLNHPNMSLIFSDPINIWKRLEETYLGDFQNQVFGVIPEPGAILNTLLAIRNRMDLVSWPELRSTI